MPRGKKRVVEFSPEEIKGMISAKEQEIADLNAAVKQKKKELVSLRKDLVAAEVAADKAKAEADKQAIIAAIEKSDRNAEEILAWLEAK